MIFFTKQELEKNGIIDTDIFNRKEVGQLNSKLDELLKEIEVLKTGHTIIYDDIIEEFNKLKKQYYLDKKTWRQVFFGKIFEMTLSGIVSETLAKKIVAIFGDIFTEEQINRLLGEKCGLLTPTGSRVVMLVLEPSIILCCRAAVRSHLVRPIGDFYQIFRTILNSVRFSWFQ